MKKNLSLLKKGVEIIEYEDWLKNNKKKISEKNFQIIKKNTAIKIYEY